MTIPMRSDDQDPLEILKRIKNAVVPPDPLDELKALRDPNRNLHEEYRSGRLERRMARLNQNDREMAEAETPSMGERIGGNLANLIADVPGGEALVAGLGRLKGQSYTDSRQALDRARASSPAGVRIPARLTGGVASAMVIPGSPAMQGARYGVASGLLDADPEAGIPERLQSAATKGTVGLVTGKATDKILNTARPLVRSLGTKLPDENLVTRDEVRTQLSAPLYEKFRQLGDLGRSPKLDKLLDLPIIKTALNTVKGESDELVDLADTDARVLDAVYKKVGSKAFRLKHGYGPSTARDALGAEMDALSGGLYSPALKAFGEASKGMQAVERGMQTLENAASKGGAKTIKGNLTRSPAALEKWAGRATEAEREGATEGVLGQLRREPWITREEIAGTRALPRLTPAVRAAPKVLEALGDRPGTFLEILRALTTTQAANLPR